MSATSIYVKTPKGIEEINARSNGLSARMRQLLIMMDGKRSSSEIAKMMPVVDCEAHIACLADDGFIVALQQAPQQEVALGKTADKMKAPQNDAERFEMAKNFMRNTVQTFLGVMGSGFINQVNKCTSFDELRRNISAWKEAMELSNDGRRQLADLENRLAALLS